jgi:hypothetical protein
MGFRGPQPSGKKRYQIFIDPDLHAKAGRIGNGNVSAGIERALKRFAEDSPPDTNRDDAPHTGDTDRTP